eukprot:1377040-Amphidinium_carterae.1
MYCSATHRGVRLDDIGVIASVYDCSRVVLNSWGCRDRHIVLAKQLDDTLSQTFLNNRQQGCPRACCRIGE